MTNNDARPPGKWSFSLRTLVGLTTFAAMAIGLVVMNRQVATLIARNQALVKTVELGRHLVSQQTSNPNIEDPAAGFVIWLERVK